MNFSGSNFSREDGDSSVFCVDINVYDEMNSKESLLRVSECGSDWGGGKIIGGEENFILMIEVVVKRVDNECINVVGS